jgi:thiol-disulfide isomerase/thioredoxin
VTGIRFTLLLPLVGALPVMLAFAQAGPRKATALEIHMPGGSSKPLSAYQGKTVLLAFLNYGCEHCEKFADELNKIAREYRPRGVDVVGVVFEKDAKDHAALFHQRFGQDFPVGYSDEATVMNWLDQPLDQGYFVPILAFVTRNGIVESEHMGDDIFFADPDKNIRLTLDKMLGKPRRANAK